MREQPRRRIYDTAWILVLTAVVFVVDVQTPLGIAGGVLYVLPVVFSMWLLSSRGTFLITLSCAVLTLVGFILSPPGPEPIWMALVNRVYSLIAFGLMGGVHYLHEKVMEKNRRIVSKNAALEALLDIGTALQALFDAGTIKETAVEKARQLFRADMAGLALLQDDGLIHWEVLTGARTQRSKVGVKECIGGQVISSGEPVIIEDIQMDSVRYRDKFPLVAEEELQAVLAVPVRVAGRPCGALMVGHRRPNSFDLGDLKLLMGLANQVSVAIDNANLQEKLKGLSALEERQQIACELHDGLAQMLGHITARSTAAVELLNQEKADEARAHLERLREVSDDASVYVRESIQELRKASSLDYQFLRRPSDVIRWVAEQEEIELRLEGGQGIESREFSPAMEVQAMRILQEAFRNIKKHSQSSEAYVRLEENGRWIQISVRDEGEGFQMNELKSTTNHYGIRMMRERAEAVGGQFEIMSTPGGGTTLQVRFPVQRTG